MHAYLVALADHFDLRRHIRFNSRLLRLDVRRRYINRCLWMEHSDSALCCLFC